MHIQLLLEKMNWATRNIYVASPVPFLAGAVFIPSLISTALLNYDEGQGGKVNSCSINLSSKVLVEFFLKAG